MRVVNWLALALIVLPCIAHAENTAPHWQVLADKSSIEWSASYGGQLIKGSFSDFTADVVFDPQNLNASKVIAKIAMAKVKSTDSDAEASLPTNEWFGAAQYPVAVFETNNFKHIEADNFEATGTLTIRDKTIKITLPFTAKFYDDKDTSPPTHYARIMGETTLNRLDFGVGQGDWAKTDVVANEVKLAIHIEAKQVP